MKVEISNGKVDLIFNGGSLIRDRTAIVFNETLSHSSPSISIKFNGFNNFSYLDNLEYSSLEGVKILLFRDEIYRIPVQMWLDTTKRSGFITIFLNQSIGPFWSDLDDIYADIAFSILNEHDYHPIYRYTIGLELDDHNLLPIECLNRLLSASKKILAERFSNTI